MLTFGGLLKERNKDQQLDSYYLSAEKIAGWAKINFLLYSPEQRKFESKSLASEKLEGKPLSVLDCRKKEKKM